MPTTTYAYVKVSLMRYNRLIGVNMEFVLLGVTNDQVREAIIISLNQVPLV